VYVHVPFCARRCSYCDFSIAVRARVPVDEYLAALRAELGLRYPRGAPWLVDTLYFGGGTPSRLGPGGVARMVALLREQVTLADGAEVTLEANPEDVDEEAAGRWREAGVNRLSLGSQTFHAEALRWMHRTHDAAQIGRAVRAARAAGIDNISLDLIFGLPEMLGREWRRDLQAALALAPQHLSVYGLTVEPFTPVGRWRDRGEVAESPASRHNLSYWSGRPYAGLGPSAHAFDGAVRRWNVRHYAEWERLLRERQDPEGGREELDSQNRLTEEVYLGLRTCRGLVLAPGERARVEPWIEAGWAELRGERLRLTPTGWLRLDALAASLTAARSH
jgi:oxygen-independent coproporphyrinogen-3 oxidase